MHEMRVWPLAVGGQDQAANQLGLRRSRAVVVSVESKGAGVLRQMGSVKANVSEPLMKGRKITQTMSKPGLGSGSGSSVGEDLFATGVTSGLEAARARIRLMHGTLEPVAAMTREKPKRGDRKGESTDARHRGGTTRSSDEAVVTGGERRGRVIVFRARGNRLGGRNP